MPPECPVDGAEMERVARYAEGETHWRCPACGYVKREGAKE